MKTDVKAGGWPRLLRIGCGMTFLCCVVLTLIGAVVEGCAERAQKDAIPRLQTQLNDRVQMLERRVEALEKRLESVEPERR